MIAYRMLRVWVCDRSLSRVSVAPEFPIRIPEIGGRAAAGQ